MADLGYDSTGQLMSYHSAQDCTGRCPIHDPSDHHMVGWPLHLRADLVQPLMERLCPQHGIGHPDPDSVEFIIQITGDDGWGIHGCCGCCRSPT